MPACCSGGLFVRTPVRYPPITFYRKPSRLFNNLLWLSTANNQRRKSTEEPTLRSAGLQISAPPGDLRLRDSATTGCTFRRFTDKQPTGLRKVREDTRD